MFKESKGLLIFTIVIVVLLISVLSFGIIMQNKSKIPVSENNIENKKGEDSTILSALGKELFLKTSLTNGSYYPLYQDINTTYDTITIEERLALTYAYGNFLGVTYENRASSNNIDDCYDTETAHYLCDILIINKDEFEYAYHELFGSDKKIEYQDFVALNELRECSLAQNNLECFTIPSGDFYNNIEYINYDHAEVSDSDIVIYVNYLFEEYNDNSYKIYTKDKKEIDSLDEQITVNNHLDIDYLFSKYSDKVSKYKVTFKKDSNNNYYWHQSELIK